jgi:hypothetical protein
MGPQFPSAKTIALVGIICAQIFCMRAQQTLALSGNDLRTPIADVLDGEGFLQTARRLARPLRDNA